jgi:hypothetical protein
MRTHPFLPVLAILTLPIVSACGTDPAVRAASRGDLPALQHELDAEASNGKLDDGTVRAVSRALLEHDLERVSGPEGVKRVEALAMCAAPMKSKLEGLASGGDEVAAAAAWVLVDSDLAPIDAYVGGHEEDQIALWRAIATRGMIDQSEATLRAGRSKSDDKYVRRAAIEAAGDAGCASDFPLLLEAARHDPETINRIVAVRMLARIADRLETDALRADLVDRLTDLWKGGDDPLRGAIARAWAAPALLNAGGLRELQAVALNTKTTEEGHVAVETAAALMMAGQADGELRLTQLATNSDASVKSHALRLLDPARPAHLDALMAAILPKKGAPEDTVAREVAAERIARFPESIALPTAQTGLKVDPRAEAKNALMQLSASKDRVGTDAAIALADLGVDAMRPRLLEELKTASPMRVRAASALVRLGHPEDVRSLLSAPDLDLRDSVACAVLGTAKT